MTSSSTLFTQPKAAAASPRTEASGFHPARRSDSLSSTVQVSNLHLQFAKRNYYIESLLLEENISLRSYHGVTHRLRDISTSEYVSELILLKDLILYLCDYDKCIEFQEKYDEE